MSPSPLLLPGVLGNELLNPFDLVTPLFEFPFGPPMAPKKSLLPPRLAKQTPLAGAGLPSPQYLTAALELEIFSGLVKINIATEMEKRFLII